MVNFIRTYGDTSKVTQIRRQRLLTFERENYFGHEDNNVSHHCEPVGTMLKCTSLSDNIIAIKHVWIQILPFYFL